jgi:hypothetical protein
MLGSYYSGEDEQGVCTTAVCFNNLLLASSSLLLWQTIQCITIVSEVMSFPLNIFLLYPKLSYVYMSIARLVKSCLTFCFAVVTVLSFLGHITLQPPFFLLLLPLPTGLLFMQSPTCLQNEFFFLDVLLLGLGFRLLNIQEEEKHCKRRGFRDLRFRTLLHLSYLLQCFCSRPP